MQGLVPKILCLNLSLALALLLPLQAIQAAEFDSALPVTPVTEFVTVTERESGVPLIKVQILGAVAKPGVYHIPVDTDLMTALSFAGGTQSSADHNNIVFKKNADATRLISVDLEEMMELKEKDFVRLESKSIVFVKPEKPLIGGDTMAVIGLVGSLLGIVVGGLVLSKNL